MRILHIATLNNAQPTDIVPSTDKFSRRLGCRIVNCTQVGVQKHHSDAVILFVSSHNKRAMNNAASVAFFGHIALM